MQNSGLPSSSNFYSDNVNKTEGVSANKDFLSMIKTAFSSGKKIYLVGKGGGYELKAMSRFEAFKAWITPGVKVHLTSTDMMVKINKALTGSTDNELNFSAVKSSSKKFEPSKKAKGVFEKYLSNVQENSPLWKLGNSTVSHTERLDIVASVLGLSLTEAPPSNQIAKTLLEQKDMISRDNYAAPSLHRSNMDSNMVKGSRVGFAVRNIDNEEKVTINFQLTQLGINKLKMGSDALKKAQLPKINMTEGEFKYFSSKQNGAIDTQFGESMIAGEALEISIDGLGTVTLGIGPPPHHALNGEVNVVLDSSVDLNKAGEVLNKMFAVLGIEGVVSDAKPDDTERLKMMSMFQILHPNIVWKLMNENALEMDKVQLKDLMIKLSPNSSELKNNFDGVLQRMYQQEVRPGQNEWALGGIADKMRQNGAMGLMAGTSLNSAILMMQGGALSSHERFLDGRLISGASSASDLERGGGRHVFTRLITDEVRKNEIKDENFQFAGKCQLCFDLDVAERVCYMYSNDQYGSKDPVDYVKRTDVVTTAKHLHESDTSNELMVKGRIPPAQIRAIVVQTEQNKIALIDGLTAAGLIDKDGMINGKKVDQFVIVAPRFKAEFWAKTVEMTGPKTEAPKIPTVNIAETNEPLANLASFVEDNKMYISTEGANQLLENQSEGTVLLRFSPTTKEFYLVTKGTTEQIKLTEYQKNALLSKGLEWLKAELTVDIKTPGEIEIEEKTDLKTPNEAKLDLPKLEELPLLNRKLSEKIVQDLPDGQYILRQSDTKPGMFVFTFKEGGVIKHGAVKQENLHQFIELKKLTKEGPVPFILDLDSIPITNDEQTNKDALKTILNLKEGQYTILRKSEEDDNVVFVERKNDLFVENLIPADLLENGIKAFGLGKLVM